MPVIQAIRGTGATTLEAMSKVLNQRGIRSARGGQWRASSVARHRRQPAAAGLGGRKSGNALVRDATWLEYKSEASMLTRTGLQITPQLVGLPPGDHGFHAHVNPNCGPAPGPNGQPAAAITI